MAEIIANYYAILNYRIHGEGDQLRHVPGTSDGIVGYFLSLTRKEAKQIEDALNLKAYTLSDRNSVLLVESPEGGMSLFAMLESEEISKRLSDSEFEESDLVGNPRLILAQFALQLGATREFALASPPAEIAPEIADSQQPAFNVLFEGRELRFNPADFNLIGKVGCPFDGLEKYFEQGEKVFRVDFFGHGTPVLTPTTHRDAVQQLVFDDQIVPEHLQHLASEFHFDPEKIESQVPKINSIDSTEGPRIRVTQSAIYLDGLEFPFKGGPKTVERLSTFFRELVETRDYVTMTSHDLRSENVRNQCSEIQALFDRDGETTSGFRIDHSWFNKPSAKAE